jgi:hypothetical protein
MKHSYNLDTIFDAPTKASNEIFVGATVIIQTSTFESVG